MENMFKFLFITLFNMCLFLGFSQDSQEYGYLVVHIIDTNTVTRSGTQLINNDNNLHNVFRDFKVFSYKYAYPKVKNEYLRRFASIECNCNVEELAIFLKENYSNYFSEIEYVQDFDYPDYDPSDYMWHITGQDGTPWLWHLKIIEAANAWDITKGSSDINIAIIDRGFDISHPDLENKILSTTDSRTGLPFGYNTMSHGTFVASFAGAETDGGGQLASIGFNTMLRFYDYVNISSADYAYHASFEKGADVLSYSRGGGTTATLRERLLVKEVLDNNTVIVRSAGNIQTDSDNNRLPFAHQVDSRIIIVSSTDKNDNHTFIRDEEDENGVVIAVDRTHANYSEVTICAPGYEMMGASRYDNGNISWPYYGNSTGTSFAAPIAAGVCALLKSINKCLSPADIKNIIQATADTIADEHLYQGLLGAGRINAYNAVQMALTYLDDISINTSQHWQHPRNIYSDIIIESGVILTITSTVKVADNRKITIQPGGTLILNGATLTNACEGEMWQGITVLGDPTKPLETAYQGCLHMINGSKIENALCAVTSIDGGHVLALNSFFKNNTI